MEQLCSWEHMETPSMTVMEVAKQLRVSSATVHNWMKIGYLDVVSSNVVSTNSVYEFINQHVGKTKLTSRANKLYGDSVGSHKNAEGIYYTPEYIIDDMFESIPHISSDSTFLEPCCGSGNFVMKAIDKGFAVKNIYAFDTDEQAIETTKRRVFEKTGYDSPNIVYADFLKVCPTIKQKFDYIYTNPPWGKKVSKQEKERWGEVYNTGESVDTCALFVSASLKVLRQGGYLSFLLPEAFFNVGTFEDIREKILSLQILSLTDYGRAFRGLLTKAMAVTLQNRSLVEGNRIVCKNEQKDTIIRTQESFIHNPKKVFNFNCSQEEVITHIYQTPHITLEGHAHWGLGVVTGDNNRICTTTPKDDYVPIYRGKDITSGGLLPVSLYINRDLRGCQQTAPMELYHAPKKIIYRFISDKLIFYCDNEQRYILNSANMLVLDKFPLTYEQLADVLNSKFMNWLFQSLFVTHKVLRGDLEKLPIFVDYFKQHPQFDEVEYIHFIGIEEDNGTYRIAK